MLRHIISASLAMTACATFIPTKANAVSLTLVPVGSLKRNPGDTIEFILAFNPGPSNGNIFLIEDIVPVYDGDELSYVKNGIDPPSPNTPVTNTLTIARFIFNVIKPVKDGKSDVNAGVFYSENGISKGIANTEELDVEPVPEPLTIFGTATALGGAVLFKRKSFNKNKKATHHIE